jgi:electron transport complex protein RnfC
MSEARPGDRLYHFPGGLKLRHHKKVSCEIALERAPLPEILYVPLGRSAQDAGRVLVESDDFVLKGQPLTRVDDDLQVTVHAPTSGRIAETVDRPASWPPGRQRPCLTLVPDGRDNWMDPEPLDDWADIDRGALIDHLRAMGLTGLGGAMFPTAAKLRGDWPSIDTLIVNGAECEPWISCDEMLMRTAPEKVISGALVLARAVGATQVLIGIEDQMNTVESRLNKARKAVNGGDAVRVVKVTTIYPEGGERQLIQVLTGREVPHDGLPQDLGVVCHNVATAAAGHDAVIEGRPVVERIVTVTGPGIAAPRNLITLIGTTLSHLLDQAGGPSDDTRRLILGGPMSGIALPCDQGPVTKGTNCLLALVDQQFEQARPTLPCINCGECVRVCPASLLPQMLFKSIAAERWQEAAELHLSDCIDCGCCAQVCPSHIPLVDWYRHGKGELELKRLDDRRAALAKRRHDTRNRRLESERAERQARRERRREKLAEPDQARDEIQAAIERARARKR